MNTSFQIDLAKFNSNNNNNNNSDNSTNSNGTNNGNNTPAVNANNNLNNLNVNVNSNSVNHNEASSDNCVGGCVSSCVSGVVGGLPEGLPFLPTLGPESFYPHPPPGFDFKENIEAWRSSYVAQVYGGYPMLRAGYGMDFNGSRRKNATRETTSTLKAWLNEHRKNPYPTKAEKIMLAIMTQMTLTQVSTWFANARRRLKKENKMTWSPRNRCDEDTRDIDVGTPLGSVNILSSSPSSFSSSSPSSSTSTATTTTVNNNCIKNETHPHPHPIMSPAKPKIWSIVDTATNNSATLK